MASAASTLLSLGRQLATRSTTTSNLMTSSLRHSSTYAKTRPNLMINADTKVICQGERCGRTIVNDCLIRPLPALANALTSLT